MLPTCYLAVVLSTLLYGLETWTTKIRDLQQLNVFHFHCVRVIVGICRRQQWHYRITFETLAKTLGIPSDIGHIICERHLRWLGHVAQMNDSRLPKCALFGEMSAVRPRHGPRRRWRNVIVDDLRVIHPPIPLSSWYSTAQDRAEWRDIAHQEPSSTIELTKFPYTCGRVFRRPGDLKRHRSFRCS